MAKVTTALTKVDELKNWMMKNTESISDALPKHFNPERMMRIFLTCIRRNPKLAKCDRASLAGALMQAAQLGLEPGDGLSQCALIPYGSEAKFQIMYAGLVDLVMRTGRVLDIRAKVILKGDQYEYSDGINQVLEHVPDRDRMKEPTWDDIIMAYAVADLPGGVKKIEVMEKWDLVKVRSVSKASNKPDSPWKVWPCEMCKKSVLKRICKNLPKSAELQTALALDTLAETGRPQDLASTWNIVSSEPVGSPESDDVSPTHTEVQGEIMASPGATSKPKGDQGAMFKASSAGEGNMGGRKGK